MIEVKNEDKINNYERISNRNINLIIQYVNKNNEKVLDIDLVPSIDSSDDIVLRDIEKHFKKAEKYYNEAGILYKEYGHMHINFLERIIRFTERGDIRHDFKLNYTRKQEIIEDKIKEIIRQGNLFTS